MALMVRSSFRVVARPRLVALVGGILFVIGVVGLGDGARYSLFGQSVVGKTVAFYAAQARSASVIATVLVDIPPDAPFQQEVDDWAGLGDWEVGGPAPLRCAAIHSDHVSCLYDSALELYLQPLIFLALGAVGLAYGARRRR